MRINMSSLMVVATCLTTGCATQSIEGGSSFNPKSEGAVILFGKACIDLYPKNDGSLEAWLARPGVEKLKRSERSATSTKSSVEYLVHSAATYSLVFEKINLCTVRFTGVDSESVSSSLAEFRAGLVNSGLNEETARRESRRRVNSSYEYSKSDNFVLRIDYSAERDGGTTISAVSSLRSDNL